MSVGTSDTTVISSTKTEARNLNAIDASAAQRGDSSPATIPTTTPKNRQSCILKIYGGMHKCIQVLSRPSLARFLLLLPSFFLFVPFLRPS